MIQAVKNNNRINGPVLEEEKIVRVPGWEQAVNRLFIDEATQDEKMKLILLHRLTGTGGFKSDEVIERIIDSLDGRDEGEGENLQSVEIQGFLLGLQAADCCL